jgi:hypothetical protein
MRSLIAVLTLSYTVAIAAQIPTEPPPPPPKTLPAVDEKTIRVNCIDCGGRFTLAQHKEVLKRLVGGGAVKHEHLAELRKAMYWQDSIHQFESKAHFDNCAFGDGAQYIQELLDEAGRKITSAEKLQRDGDLVRANKETLDAFFALGQALHAIQDFYAHSNYVELERAKKRPFAELRILPLWTQQGRASLARLAESGGLHSGYVIWGLGKRCSDGIPSHGTMSKDAEKGRGAEHVAHWENITLHRVARSLATEASLAFLKYAYGRWPYLAKVAGKEVVFDVFQDRRGL